MLQYCKQDNGVSLLSCCGIQGIVVTLESLLLTSTLGNIIKHDHQRFNLLDRAMRSFMTDRCFWTAACLNTLGSD